MNNPLKTQVSHLQNFVEELERMRRIAEADQNYFLAHMFEMGAMEASDLLQKASRRAMIKDGANG